MYMYLLYYAIHVPVFKRSTQLLELYRIMSLYENKKSSAQSITLKRTHSKAWFSFVVRIGDFSLIGDRLGCVFQIEMILILPITSATVWDIASIMSHSS